MKRRIKVLIACERSGVVREAFNAYSGVDATSCDLVPCDDGRDDSHHQGDVLKILDDGWDAMVAHPDCTRLANSGVRWLLKPPPGKTMVQMWRGLFRGAAFYRKLRDAHIPMKAIENPVMHCHARELVVPLDRQVVQPWWFGDPFFKATGFELVGLPKLVPTDRLTPPRKGTQEHKEWSMVHRASPGPNRARERSRSFTGMAQAMAEQWLPVIWASVN